ncbi:hypothetical protein BB561_004004 [Smittium simulii]|uniref:Pacifastin domain-containing protein n=1 Tax=Smittium simulii TaxID=133385 RepID=A0A2T9YIL9_9FUNG|nr:hypothetical protein BB561_004004 [Smittium simulii]
MIKHQIVIFALSAFFCNGVSLFSNIKKNSNNNILKIRNDDGNYKKCVEKYGKGTFENPLVKTDLCVCTENGKTVCLDTTLSTTTKESAPYLDCVKSFGTDSFAGSADECSYCHCLENGGVVCDAMDCLI